MRSYAAACALARAVVLHMIGDRATRTASIAALRTRPGDPLAGHAVHSAVAGRATPAAAADSERRVAGKHGTDREETSMNETYVTLRGWLGGEVRHRLAGDTPVAEFRLGVTPRYFDKQRSDWVDGDTSRSR